MTRRVHHQMSCAFILVRAHVQPHVHPCVHPCPGPGAAAAVAAAVAVAAVAVAAAKTEEVRARAGGSVGVEARAWARAVGLALVREGAERTAAPLMTRLWRSRRCVGRCSRDDPRRPSDPRRLAPSHFVPRRFAQRRSAPLPSMVSRRADTWLAVLAACRASSPTRGSPACAMAARSAGHARKDQRPIQCRMKLAGLARGQAGGGAAEKLLGGATQGG